MKTKIKIKRGWYFGYILAIVMLLIGFIFLTLSMLHTKFTDDYVFNTSLWYIGVGIVLASIIAIITDYFENRFRYIKKLKQEIYFKQIIQYVTHNNVNEARNIFDNFLTDDDYRKFTNGLICGASLIEEKTIKKINDINNIIFVKPIKKRHGLTRK